MREEYERYKDLWGLNIFYNSSAGPAKNYSELTEVECFICVLAEKKSLELQLVHIYFDTATFDNVEKDVKVRRNLNIWQLVFSCYVAR